MVKYEEGHLLFIYGTLRRGGRAHYLMNGAEYIGRGSIAGAIVHVDQYPGLILGAEGLVKGEIYSVGDDLRSELDRYEGCFESPPHYSRESVEVLLEDGKRYQADTYVFLFSVEGLEEISCGDWLEWMEHKKA